MYATLADLREYLGLGDPLENTGDDALLTTLLAAAQAAIDVHCGRVFEAVTETRYFDQRARVYCDPRALDLDQELLSVTTLTNGDAAVISAADYRLEPWNETPKRLIRLLTATAGWTFPDDGRVTVAGSWGYSTVAPAPVAHATKRLAAYFYRQRDAQVFEVTAMPELGQMIIPQGMPADVRVLLKPYVRFKGFR